MIECNCMIPVMNYGSSASYKAEPSPEQIATGVIPLDSLPAAWWNCMWSQTNTAVNQARQELGQLIVELNNVLCNAGVCPQDVCTDQLYQSIEKIRQTLGNATTAGAVKSSSCPSEVAINQTTGMMSVNCLGNAASLTTSARTVVGAINELKSTYDQCFTDTGTAIAGKAPTSHVSDATTYGVGNADCYGHLKISDTYTCDLGCTGMAASQSALYCVYDFAATIAAGVASLGNTAGCPLGTASAGTAVTAARSDHVHPSFIPSCSCWCNNLGQKYVCWLGDSYCMVCNKCDFPVVLTAYSMGWGACWMGAGTYFIPAKGILSCVLYAPMNICAMYNALTQAACNCGQAYVMKVKS